jgi:hypothetical protein
LIDAVIGAGLSLCPLLLICHSTQLQQYGLVLVVPTYCIALQPCKALQRLIVTPNYKHGLLKKLYNEAEGKIVFVNKYNSRSIYGSAGAKQSGGPDQQHP